MKMTPDQIYSPRKLAEMNERLRNWKQHTVTAGQLREYLEKVPDDTPVILQKDAEGNGYSPLSSLDRDCVYVPETTWSGEVHDTTDPDYEPDDRDVKVILLGPVN